MKRTTSVIAMVGLWTLVQVTAAAPVEPYETADAVVAPSALDACVDRGLARLGAQAAYPCSDVVFIRRVYLDVIGVLPTVDGVESFVADTAANKRADLIDQLLEDERFADYWAMKWCDVLRVKAEFPINLWPNAVQAYHRWVRAAVREQMPYDVFARELLTASGSNFRVPQVNFYRAVQSRDAQALSAAAALTFMGVRVEPWPVEQREQLAAFFAHVSYKDTAEWKEQIVYFDPFTIAPGAPRRYTFPDGAAIAVAPEVDPRQVFADWLIQPDNPWFTRCAVNRIWYWLLGRGLIHEPDDIRDDNPLMYPEALAHLQTHFVASGYNLKQVMRLILNSRTYQLSSMPRDGDKNAPAHFACYPLTRLDAEVLIDALNQITGATDDYSSPIPEPFTFIPEDQCAVAIADGSISSSFLEMFGRPPRDTGLASERNTGATPSQRLHMLNSSHVRNKIERSSALRDIIATSRKEPRRAVDRLYLTILSRYPTEAEIEAIRRHMKADGVRQQDVLIDVVWALINSTEFQYRH